MRRRLFVISNPGAGLSHSSLIDDAVRALERAGASLTRVRPASIDAARLAAREAAASGSYDAIVAAGGDGTIRHVASALIDSGTPLGIIPVGTGNVLAHEIGLSRHGGCHRAARCSTGRRRGSPARMPTASRSC